MEKEGKLEQLQELVVLFQANFNQYRGSGYDEANVRTDFIDKFFEILDWDVRNLRGYSEQYREVVREDKVEIKGKLKAPDYSFRIGGVRKFFVEAKKPSINIKDDIVSAFQLRRYAYTAKLPLSILTDFEEFAVYDTRIKPDKSDSASVARIFYCTFNDYNNHFGYISDTFSKEAILKGSFDRYMEDKKRKKGTSEVDWEFLKLIEKWRDELARNIALRNDDLSLEELNDSVQKTIDRIIFLRIAEDRGMETYGRLMSLMDKEGVVSRGLHSELSLKSGQPHAVTPAGIGISDLYPRLFNLFAQADVKYNSGLFDFKTDILTPKLKIDDKVLKGIINELYYPDSPYEFSVLPVEILGNIYEQFLGKTIRLTAGHQAKVEDKPEVKKAGGVYYTPKYIVDYIVRNTVGEMLKTRKIVGVHTDISKKHKEHLRIVDPACGSGSFLLGAYQLLLDHYLDWYTGNGSMVDPKSHSEQKKKDSILKKSLKGNRIYQVRDNEFRLTIQEKQRILVDHIYGVDIDRQAMEVTKLSLLLKLLEGENLESTGYLFKHSDIKLLPNLSENIKCGNSLIGSDFYKSDQKHLFGDEETMRRVNVFDWEKGFSEVFADGGFDVVIGNPPYFNVDDTWGKHDQRLVALKSLYPHIYNDKTDILFYFLGKSVELCKGSVGFIVSRAFLEAYKADKLRKYLASHSAINQIIDFQNFHVFKGVGITTCIIIFKPNKPQESTHVYKLRLDKLSTLEFPSLLSDSNVFDYIEVSQKKMGSLPWELTSSAISGINAKIDSTGESLDKIFIIGQGMQTGRNDVFGERTQDEINSWHLKPGLFYKRASNSDIQRYFIRDRGEFILFLQDENVFEKLPSGVKKHLLMYSVELKNRAAYQRGNCEWWKFTWPLHEEYYNRKRILCPYLASYNRFALVENSEFLSLTDTTVLFENGQPENILYILGLLNSKLLTFRFKSIGKLKSGGIYEYFWNSISKLPIRRINFSNTTDREMHDKLVDIVLKMLILQKKYYSARLENDKNLFKKQIEILDHQIDQLVYKLFDLTDDEVSIVEAG
jgi:adenine-specific DNA-methyltransferase